MTVTNARRKYVPVLAASVGCQGAPGALAATGDAGELGIDFLDELRSFFVCQNLARLSM
jgi:hypothetical protein